MTNEEKIGFINSHNIKNKLRLLFVITSVLLWMIFILFLWYFIEQYNFLISNIMKTVIYITLVVIIFILGKKSNTAIFKNKKLFKKILNENMYC